MLLTPSMESSAKTIRSCSRRISRAPGPGWSRFLNTGASLESVGRAASRIWSDAPDWTADARFMERLDEWCTTGRIGYDSSELHSTAAIGKEAIAVATRVAAGIRRRRVLALMLGDTSMGMINGYFGPRLLYPIGFSEHKVDQAWLLERTRSIDAKRVADAFQFVQDHGVVFHWNEQDAADFTAESTREQLRGYLAVLDLLAEFQADCVGWQYQLGLLKLLPPSDFAEGLLNSHCRPEGDGRVVITSTEADQGNLIPMELMKRALIDKGLPEAVMFHDVRWGARHEGRFLWVLLNSGSCSAYAFNHDVTVSPECTATGSRPATSPCPAAPSPARASPARSPGPAPGSTAPAGSSWTWAAASRSHSLKPCASRGGRAQPASGPSWPPTWAVAWKRLWPII